MARWPTALFPGRCTGVRVRSVVVAIRFSPARVEVLPDGKVQFNIMNFWAYTDSGYGVSMAPVTLERGYRNVVRVRLTDRVEGATQQRRIGETSAKKSGDNMTVNTRCFVDTLWGFRQRYRYMSLDLAFHGSLSGNGESCQLVVRKEKSLSEILQFTTAGLEIGQQVVIMAGPTCLKDVAHGLTETGLKTDALLHSGRMVFLTAPNCLAELFRPSEPLQRSPLHRHATVMRWITDWSWVYGNGSNAATIRDYQRRLHEFIRPFNAMSMCTVLCEKLQRSDLLAMLVDHRRVAKTVEATRRAVAAHA